MRITFLALFVVAVTAAPKNPSRILGGDETTIDKYPSMAALIYSPDMVTFRWFCGGTIINNRSVMSAAHCIYTDTVETIRVRVGSSFSSSGGEILPLASMIIHPDYSQMTLHNDITILRTSVQITYSDIVQPAPIAGPSYNVADNEVVWATGWGITEAGVPSEQLRDLKVWTINQDTCRRRYAFSFIPITTDMLCIGNLNVANYGHCMGDSGGPAYHNGVVIGVCSFGSDCGSRIFPNVNTRVSSYSTWLQENA